MLNNNVKSVNVYQANIIYTVLKIIGWVLGLWIVTNRILYKLENEFGGAVKDELVEADSYITYRQSILIMCGICAVLALLWWVVPNINLRIKEHFESFTFMWAILVVVLCIAAAVVLQSCYPGVCRRNDNQTLDTLRYVWYYPCLFIGGILLFSPNNICEVVTPLKRWKRYIIGIICIILSATVCI